MELLYQERVHEICRNIILDDKFELGKTSLLMKRTEATIRFPGANTVWYEILCSYGFNETQVADFLNLSLSSSGKIFYSDQWNLLVDRDTVRITPIILDESKFVYINKSDEYVVFDDVKININLYSKNDYQIIEKESSIALLDFEKLHFPLVLRRVKNGDKFVPFGMKGKKLVSDYLPEGLFMG